MGLPLYGGREAHFKGFFSTLQGRVLKKCQLELKKSVFEKKVGYATFRSLNPTQPVGAPAER
ncbi:MAG: hypothetical protein CME49_05490 [Halieaceae bacterium]|nr:hypothetical protein [Halieaceae bacterium]